MSKLSTLFTKKIWSPLAFTVLAVASVSYAADVKLPMLPGAAVAQTVINTALSSSEMVSQAPKAVPATLAVVQTSSRATGRSQMVFATAYSSDAAQTDATPFITATGTRTRPGVLAVSRDLLRTYPYGTRVRLEDPSGRNPWLSNRVFIVEDTMNPRFTNRIDVWMGSRAQALQWGGRSIRMTALK